MNIKPKQPYSITYVPKQIALEDVDAANQAGRLPRVNIQAGSADEARTKALRTFDHVYSVDRIDTAEPLAA